MPVTVRLRGGLDAGALEQALIDVVGRHEALRTSYRAQDGEPWQHIADPAEVTVPFAVVAIAEDELSDRLAEFGLRPFDLASDLLVRAVLLELSPQDHVLLLVVHHIAFDGWSITPFMRDLGTAYTARVAGAAPAWVPLPVQYADFALWQRDLLAADEERQLGFWRERLAGLPAEVTFSFDRPRPAVASYRGAIVHGAVSGGGAPGAGGAGAGVRRHAVHGGAGGYGGGAGAVWRRDRCGAGLPGGRADG